MARLSIIIPVHDEGEAIAAALDALADLRVLGTEIIVVDGGSRDATVQRARLRSDRVVSARPGRVSQMNAGAEKASGDVLLFLDADTRLPKAADHLVLDGLARSGRAWGRFDLSFARGSRMLRFAAWLMSLQSWLTGTAIGDQAIFVRRDAFQAVGGFPEIAFMEDVALSKSLKRQSRPLCLRDRVVAPPRRFATHGVWPTLRLTFRLRIAYFFGADPQDLARQYAQSGGPEPAARTGT